MSHESVDVLIVGAGWAGLSAAYHLADSGQRVVVVEKGRGPGGRSATRRHGAWRFDHGAQYFTATSASFQSMISQWSDQQRVALWSAPIETIGPRPPHVSTSELGEPLKRWVGNPGNNAPLSALAESLSVVYQHKIESIKRCAKDWEVIAKSDGQLRQWSAKTLVLTAPPRQSAELLGHGHPLYQSLCDHPMAPTWAVMVAFDTHIDVSMEAAFVNQGPLSWFCRQSTKPSRSGEAWVMHATGAWSKRHLEDAPQWVAQALFESWRQLLGIDDALVPSYQQAHRWRYAQSEAPLDAKFLAKAEDQLFIAGDWCFGNRVEGAWLSGQAVAKAVAG